MPNFQLEATANGVNNAWTASAGNKWDCVADSDDGTYIQITGVSSPARQSFVTQDLPSEASSIVGSVTFNARGKDGTATADLIYSHFRYSGANYEDATGWNFTTSVAAYTRAWATGPGAAAWTPTLLNACEMGVYREGNTNTVQVAKLNITGEYSVSAGNFAYLICSLVGGLLGAQLMLSDIPGIAREVWNNPRIGEGRTLIRPYEYNTVLAELKAHPFRKVVDLGEHRIR